MNDQRRGLMFASFTALLWGFLAIALKIAVAELSPVTVVWYRFASAFIMLVCATLIVKRSDFGIFRKPPFKLFIAAIFLGLNYLGFISGIKYLSPSTSQVFIMVGPVSFALSGIIIFKEQVNWKHISGFLMVVAGILLFYSRQLLEISTADTHFLKGMFLVFGGGLSWAVFASLQKTLVKQYNTNQLNLFIYGFCAIMFLPFIEINKFPELSTSDWLLMTFLGLNTVLAYGSLALAIKYTEANKVSVIITLNPIITFVTMAILTKMNVSWVRHEHFSLLSIAGALTVLLGAIVVIVAGNNRKFPLTRS